MQKHVSRSNQDVFMTLVSLKRPHLSLGEAFAIGFIENRVKKANKKAKIFKDTFGNLLVFVGATKSRGKTKTNGVLFTAHVDTVHKVDGFTKTYKRTKDDGRTYFYAMQEVEDLLTKEKKEVGAVLGADDAAGIYIMLEMIENNVTGTYAFFKGEEVGCLGSKAYLKQFPNHGFTKVISFDRKGTTDVINKQRGKTCCSKEFSEALCAELNKHYGFEYKPTTGVYTDSGEFMSLDIECTNISVGYYNEHTPNEEIDIVHLNRLAKACCVVNWESLPVVKREPDPVPKINYHNYGGWYDDWMNRVGKDDVMGEWPVYDYTDKLTTPLIKSRVNKDLLITQLLDTISSVARDVEDVLVDVETRVLLVTKADVTAYLTDLAAALYDVVSKVEDDVLPQKQVPKAKRKLGTIK